jgi:hypothetical protein
MYVFFAAFERREGAAQSGGCIPAAATACSGTGPDHYDHSLHVVRKQGTTRSGKVWQTTCILSWKAQGIFAFRLSHGTQQAGLL